MRITDKERKRASEDGYVIVVRPDRVSGGYTVSAVRIMDEVVVGWPRHVATREELSQTITSVCRDLNKFLGCGGQMASSGRMRPGRKIHERTWQD